MAPGHQQGQDSTTNIRIVDTAAWPRLPVSVLTTGSTLPSIQSMGFIARYDAARSTHAAVDIISPGERQEWACNDRLWTLEMETRTGTKHRSSPSSPGMEGCTTGVCHFPLLSRNPPQFAASSGPFPALRWHSEGNLLVCHWRCVPWAQRLC
jgi:hypothetical protein